MSGNGNGDVDIQMSFITDPADQPEKTSRPSFKDRFGNILMAYDDERTWWEAAQNLMDRDGNFAASVSTNIILYTHICTLSMQIW